MVWKQERERNAEVKEVVTAVGTSQVSMSYRGAVGPWRGVRDVRNASAKQRGGRKRAGLMMCWVIIAINIILLSPSASWADMMM